MNAQDITKVAPIRELTPRQLRFVKQYIVTSNASLAYRRAYNAGAMSDKTIREAASRLLANSNIAAMVHQLQDQALKRIEVTAERVAKELACIAFASPRDYVDDEGNAIPVHEMTAEEAASVQALSVVEHLGEDGAVLSRTHNYRMTSKLRALELLAKWQGMLVDRAEVGKPGEFDHATREELERRILHRGAKLGYVIKLPGRTERTGEGNG